MAAWVQLREITSEEGSRLLRIVRRTSGSVVTWRRAQIVLLSAQGMSPPAISEVVFTDPDTVREVIHNFNGDGFNALYPRYRGGRPQTFTLPKRQEIKRIALTDPQDLDQPFATWSLSKLADYLVAEGVGTDISHEGLRQLLREEGVRFQAVRTWKRSTDPHFKTKRERIVELYEMAENVITTIEQLIADRRAPTYLRADNGPEMIAWTLRDYCRLAGTRTAYIEPGSPWENPFVESFNGSRGSKLVDVTPAFGGRVGDHAMAKGPSEPEQHRAQCLLGCHHTTLVLAVRGGLFGQQKASACHSRGGARVNQTPHVRRIGHATRRQDRRALSHTQHTSQREPQRLDAQQMSARL
jgi:transposase